MPIENSHLIARGYPFTNIFTRINGISSDLAGRATLIAWMLEEAALQSGWQVGSFLGTERGLLAQFGVSRDTLREAIRIVEARGSMQMQRGRVGGLRLLCPQVEDVASALAAYLLACNCTAGELNKAAAAAGPVLQELGDGELVVALYRQTLDVIATGKAQGAAGTNRARTIAARLLEIHGPPPPEGIFLGDEALLNETLDCTRPALREALRLLGDLSILKVRRGRGGGFTLVQPSSDAMTRRIFGLIAAQHFTDAELMPAIWALNLIRLRMAIGNLRRLDDEARRLRCQELAASLEKWDEPERFSHLQNALDRIADNKFISILCESFTYFRARVNPTAESWNAVTAKFNEIAPALLADERALVQALHGGDYAAAEHLHVSLHGHISAVLDCPNFPA